MQQQKSPISITVDLTNCRAHLFKVAMTISGAVAKQKLSLPVWTPGSYMVREFAQHLLTVSARENGCEISVDKLDKNTFEVNNTSSELVISYDVYGFDSSIRAAYIDDYQAFFNGTALFLRPHGLDEQPYQLKIQRPQGKIFETWQVATGMSKHDVDTDGFGSYQARTYDELVDHPFQISAMKRLFFVASTIPHEIVLVGDVRPFNEERLSHDLSKLCTHQIELFGGTAPFSSYTFIARFEEGGYGGLEHSNSSMLLSSPYCLPNKDGEPDSNYRNFLGLCSHEYFHAWNVKRLKPESFVKYDYDRECYTKLLWLFEGITSYYDDLCVRRADLISVSNYLEIMGKNYSRLLKNHGRKCQTLADSSFDAWIKFYRPNENSLNSGISYYLKGSFVGLYLDLMMRIKSEGQVSLDDIIRVAFKKFGGGGGIKEEQIFDLIENVGGIDREEFKARFIYGTEDFPIKSTLEPFGVEVSFTPDELYLDDKTKMSAFVGLRLRFDDHGRAIVSMVDQDGPSMDAGLCPLDEIIAVNGTRLELTNAADLLGSLKAQEKAEVLYARKKSVRKCQVVAGNLLLSTTKFSLKSSMSDMEKACLNSWLGVKQS